MIRVYIWKSLNPHQKIGYIVVNNKNVYCLSRKEGWHKTDFKPEDITRLLAEKQIVDENIANSYWKDCVVEVARKLLFK